MGMFDWIEWEGQQYQTKDTPNQMCDNYRVSGCGELFVEEYDAEWVRDESNTLSGMRLDTSNHRWRECVEAGGSKVMDLFQETHKGKYVATKHASDPNRVILSKL